MQRIFLFIALFAIALGSCKKDENTVTSDKKAIVSAEISKNESGFTFDKQGMIDDGNSLLVFKSTDELVFPLDLSLSIALSPKASLLSPQDVYTFESKTSLQLKVKAENGSERIWNVKLTDKSDDPSGEANIVSASVTVNESPFSFDEILISREDRKVIFVSEDNLTYPITLGLGFVVSPGAEVVNAPDSYAFLGEVPIELVVKSENGNEVIWKLLLVGNGPDTEQIINSDLKEWYEASSPSGDKTYYQPGNGVDVIWSTANPAITLFADPNVVPIMNGDKITGGAIISTVEVPVYTIGAGALFTGVFDFSKFDPDNPSAATVFGVPFTGKPRDMLVDFKYIPGPINYDRDGKVLNYPDHCDIYAILEYRNGDQKIELAKAQFNESVTISDFTTKELKFNYSNTDYQPTHISVVMTSSAEGNSFQGAIGSELSVRRVLMIYD